MYCVAGVPLFRTLYFHMTGKYYIHTKYKSPNTVKYIFFFLYALYCPVYVVSFETKLCVTQPSEFDKKREKNFSRARTAL